MKKRIFSSVILALTLLPALCLSIFAEEVGTAFPFSKFNGNYFWITSAYPAWERDFREKDNYELQYTVPVYIHVNKYDYTKVEYELFNRIDSTLAEQSAKFDVYVTDGLWDNMHGDTYPKVSDYGIQFETDHDDVNGRTKAQTMVGQWREDAAKGLSERETGVREVIEYGGGWLYKYSTRRFNYADEISGYHGEYRYLRPIPEIPGTFIMMTIRFSAVKSSLDYDDFDEAAVRALEQKWTERFFSTAYRITWNDDYWDYTMSDTAQNSAGVTQKAEETPGEDGGVYVPGNIVDGDNSSSVPAAIAVGVLGGGAAIAGAAAASGGSDDKKKKRKAYKMYVQKDFGDAIRRGGGKPVKIRARMAEVEGTVERDRNDLTGNIGVSGDGMTVHGVALAGRYCEASVSVPKEYDKDTASITFTYIGEGGSFTNTVIFRIVDGPQLKFIDERDGTLYHENCGIDAIPGDGFTYTERFAVVDAPVAPKLSDISAVNTGEFDVEFALTDQPALYKMTVKNNTKSDPEHDIFAKPVDKNFEIHVNVEGEKEPVKGYVTVKLYPEGITVSSTMEGKKNDVKYVRVQSYEKEYAGDLDRKWQVSEIKFTLAHKGKDKAIIDPKDAQYKFEKLKGAGGMGTAASKEQAIADKYDYKESWGDWNGKFTYTFEPQDMLWEPDNGTFFVALLPVTCEYDGQNYKAEIPLRLRGKDPDPMEEWNKEYAKTRERIEKFSLPSQKDYNLQQLEKIAANEPRISTWELRLMAKDVVRAYMKYWTEQNEKDKWNAAALDWTVWGLEWVKWIGDCAFSYVVAAYTGPMEAIISPAKDVLVSALGEVGVNIVWGTKFNVENLEVVAALKNAGDNFVSGWASEGAANVLKANPANIKMAAGIMGAYFAYACLNNYLEHLAKTGESDFYGAIMGAFKDLTVTAIKAAASILFGKWLESENFKNKIGPKLSAFMKKYFGEKCRINLTDQTLSYRIEANAGGTKRWMDIDAEIIKSGIVEKYFTELCGAGAAYIHDNIETAEKALFWFNPAGEIIFSFSINLLAGNVDDKSAESVMHLCDINLSKALKNTSGELFNWMYDLFFSGLPVATDVMEIPKDPPLPPAKN